MYTVNVNLSFFPHNSHIVRSDTSADRVNKAALYNPMGDKMVLFSLAVVVSLQPWKEKKKCIKLFFFFLEVFTFFRQVTVPR